MLYDWLEYNIVSVFDIIKMAKLFETEGYKIEQSWKGTLHDNIIIQMENNESRNKINNFLKQELKIIEYETLFCVAEFLNQIYPEFEEDSANFNECLENMCFRLFGFKNEDIHSSKDLVRAENILIVTRKFMDLFEFIIILIRNQYNNIDQQLKRSDGISSTRLGDTMRNTFKNSFMGKTTTSKFFPIGENEYRQILNASLLNPDKDKQTINKEKFMLNIYQTLGRYFNNNLESKY